MIQLMNTRMTEGTSATAYVPMTDGTELRTLVFVESGKLYARLPGSDAGIMLVTDPSKVYVISKVGL